MGTSDCKSVVLFFAGLFGIASATGGEVELGRLGKGDRIQVTVAPALLNSFT